MQLLEEGMEPGIGEQDTLTALWTPIHTLSL